MLCQLSWCSSMLRQLTWNSCMHSRHDFLSIYPSYCVIWHDVPVCRIGKIIYEMNFILCVLLVYNDNRSVQTICIMCILCTKCFSHTTRDWNRNSLPAKQNIRTDRWTDSQRKDKVIPMRHFASLHQKVNWFDYHSYVHNDKCICISHQMECFHRWQTVISDSDLQTATMESLPWEARISLELQNLL